MEAAVVLFNPDLRLSDHPALDAAVTTAKRIVPLFVLDDTILQRAAPNRVQFLLDCLHDFRAALHDRGGDLIVAPATRSPRRWESRAPLRPVRSWRAPTQRVRAAPAGRARPSLRSRGHCARAPSRDHDPPTRRALSLRRRSLPHLHALLRRWSDTPWRETARRRTTSRCPRSSQRTEARFPRFRSWSVGRARPTSQVAGSAAHRTGSTPGSTRRRLGRGRRHA
jgi:DNA photolyase